MTDDRGFNRAVRIVGHALRLRCPNCGARGFVASWFHLAPECPVCGFDPQRSDDGLAVGAYAFNLLAGEFVALGVCAAIALTTWPAPPWTWITRIGVALGLLLPVAFYPFSRTLFAGMNLFFNVHDPESRPRPGR